MSDIPQDETVLFFFKKNNDKEIKCFEETIDSLASGRARHAWQVRKKRLLRKHFNVQIHSDVLVTFLGDGNTSANPTKWAWFEADVCYVFVTYVIAYTQTPAQKHHAPN